MLQQEDTELVLFINPPTAVAYGNALKAKFDHVDRVTASLHIVRGEPRGSKIGLHLNNGEFTYLTTNTEYYKYLCEHHNLNN